MMHIRSTAWGVGLLLAVMVSVSHAQLENHYTFDNENDIGADSSGNDREAEIEDFERRRENFLQSRPQNHKRRGHVPGRIAAAPDPRCGLYAIFPVLRE